MRQPEADNPKNPTRTGPKALAAVSWDPQRACAEKAACSVLRGCPGSGQALGGLVGHPSSREPGKVAPPQCPHLQMGFSCGLLHAPQRVKPVNTDMCIFKAARPTGGGSCLSSLSISNPVCKRGADVPELRGSPSQNTQCGFGLLSDQVLGLGPQVLAEGFCFSKLKR